jgi:hypothetical protein
VTPAAVETPASSEVDNQQAGWQEFASNFSGMMQLSITQSYVQWLRAIIAL